ncbi:MAG: T9SS type A sorting domain-containing protein [Bacteroidia bacterium]|jgi:hypothetical protein
MKKIFLSLIVFLNLTAAQSQSKSILFLGNSYTYVNDLPKMVANVASSTGDILLFDSYAMGGATFNALSLNTDSRKKIMLGNWDYVVLQGQSLELWGDFPDILVSFPQVGVLDSLINLYSPCVETMFYRTWGRKNGFSTTSFQTLDSIIHVNYMKLADSLDAVVSPVGEVWKYIRQHYPSIELYDPDESHPSLAGTYAAACCFYTALFRKDPTLISYNPGLTDTHAADIRNAAKLIVYDSLLNWHIGEYDSLIHVDCITKVQNSDKNSLIKIFPNPFSSQTILRSNNLFYNATLTLDNCFGQTVKQINNISGQTVTFSRDNLPCGLYLLRLTEGTKIHMAKVVIADF